MVDDPQYWRNMTYQLFQFIRGIGGLLSAAMEKTVKKPILHMKTDSSVTVFLQKICMSQKSKMVVRNGDLLVIVGGNSLTNYCLSCT